MSTGFAPARARTPTRSAAAPRERTTETFTAAAGRDGSRLTRLRRRSSWPLGIYTTPVALLVLWQVTSELGWLPEKIAPAPTAIVQAGVDLWKIGELGTDLTTSLRRVGIGLAIGLTIGISTGIIAGLLRSGEYLFNGVVQIVHTIPLLAVLPLMIVWFGIDELPKVLLISVGAGLPMYLNLFAAIRGVDQRLIEMAKAAGVRRPRLITRVLLPGALPGFLVGLRFSLAYSVLGLVAAETINATAGIGFLINRAQTYLRTDQVYLGLVIYAVLGLLADQFVRILERVLLQWRPSYEAQ